MPLPSAGPYHLHCVLPTHMPAMLQKVQMGSYESSAALAAHCCAAPAKERGGGLFTRVMEMMAASLQLCWHQGR